MPDRHVAMVARNYNVDPAIEYTVSYPTAATYGQAIAGAFSFFRAHSEGRYSGTSMMRLVRASEQRNDNPDACPVIVSAHLPYSYDEDTECKVGGVVAMLVVWPQEQGRMMLAVHRDRRRQKIATALVRYHTRHHGNELATWVGNRNFAGQSLLLSCDLFPTGMNSSGAVRYATFCEEAEGDVVPTAAPEAPPVRLNDAWYAERHELAVR